MQPVYLDDTGFAGFDNGGWGGSVPVASRDNPNLPGFAELYEFDNFVRGDVDHPGVGWFPTVDLVSHGTGYAYQQLLAAGVGTPDAWVPLNLHAGCGYEDQYCDAMFAAAALRATTSPAASPRSAKHQCVLRRGAFGLDNTPLGPVDGNFGVRYVETDNTAIGNLIVGSVTGGTPAQCATAATTLNGDANPNNNLDCTTFNDAYAFSNGGHGLCGAGHAAALFVRQRAADLNVRFQLSDDLQLRLAAGRAMVRPSFSQMNPNNNIGFSFGFTPGGVPDAGHNFRANGDPVNVTGGNPYLNPTLSDQFDASLEWYSRRPAA